MIEIFLFYCRFYYICNDFNQHCINLNYYYYESLFTANDKGSVYDGSWLSLRARTWFNRDSSTNYTRRRSSVLINKTCRPDINCSAFLCLFLFPFVVFRVNGSPRF